LTATVDRVPAARGPRVQGFAAGGFSIDGAVLEGALLTPEAASAWEAPALGDLSECHVAPVLALEPAPEFLLLGTGPAMAFPPRAFVAALEARGIGVEAMDSRAAARTWGLLRGEGRWITAALMPLLGGVKDPQIVRPERSRGASVMTPCQRPSTTLGTNGI
jgi:uncharacterized protein